MAVRRRRLAALVASLVFGSATSALVLAAVGTRAWIDQPLPGAILEVAPTPVTVHAAADSGIAKVRILIDGLPAAEVGAPTGDLVVVQWTWQPPGVGTHLLTVFAVSMDGVSSEPVSVAVDIVAVGALPPTAPPVPTPAQGGPAPTAMPTGAQPTTSPGPARTPAPTQKVTPTPTPIITPGPSRTPRPTPTPCTPAPPTLLIPANGSDVSDPQPTFEWSIDSPGCPQSGFRIQISDSRTFDRIVMSKVLAAGQMSWTADPGLASCVIYSWRVQARRSDGSYGPSSAIWTFRIPARSCP